MRVLVSGGTKTLRRLAGPYADQLGVLLTPTNGNRVESVVEMGLPWGVDNGAFSGFNAISFRKLLWRVAGQPRLQWVACPDVVGDARATLDLFVEWRPQLGRLNLPVALVAQDGAERCNLPWRDFDCLFVGGTTRWKLSSGAALLCAAARGYGKWVHIGRVNSLRRLRSAWLLNADSVDGKSWNRFGETYLEWGCRFIRRLEREKTLF